MEKSKDVDKAVDIDYQSHKNNSCRFSGRQCSIQEGQSKSPLTVDGGIYHPHWQKSKVYRAVVAELQLIQPWRSRAVPARFLVNNHYLLASSIFWCTSRVPSRDGVLKLNPSNLQWV